MNNALALLPPPSERVNATWNAVKMIDSRGDGHEGVDDVHRRVDHAISLPGKKQKAAEETWTAIKNSVSEDRLTKDVIRPMFVPPRKTVPPRERDLEALAAKGLKSQRRRKPQSKRVLYSPLYPFKILQPPPRTSNRRNHHEGKRRAGQNAKHIRRDHKRPGQSRPPRPKTENPGTEDRAPAKHPYEFWRPQENFFSVQIPAVEHDTSTNRRGEGKRRRQKGRQKNKNKSDNPRELEQFWSEHLRDLSRNRSKKSRRRKHHGTPYTTHENVQEHRIPHPVSGEENGNTNIVIRVKLTIAGLLRIDILIFIQRFFR